MLRAILVAVMGCVVFTSLGEAQVQKSLSLMPMPTTVRLGSNQLVIGPTFSVSIAGPHEARLDRAVGIFLAQLGRQIGMPPIDMQVADSTNATLVIQAAGGTEQVQELGEDESYRLEISNAGARLSAPTSLGVMRGLQTFLQLVETTGQGFAVPAVSIEDSPRFPWRGLMIDVSRHFIPLEVLKRNLDGMAAVKLNVFHWHLSDNQGFRVESKKFPKLQEMGSDGLYYTQEEVRDLIAYARERGIRVVPEFDVPGHSTAWFVGYPELASGPGPYQIERQWGVFDPAMDPTREETYKFLDKFIGEMAELFPDQFFHIGGDEVNGKQWDANPKIQEFMHAHGLKNNNDLQAYFNQRVQKIVSKHGKTMLGWDEILRPDLPNSIVVQSWRGPDSLAQAAKQGYRGLLSSGYYVDLMWSAERHYLTEPLSGAAASLTPEVQKRILGGEACMWSEYVSPENVDSRIWPRTAAIAERLWSPQDVRDVNSMYQRLEEVSRRLDWLGLTHNSSYVPMLRRIAGQDDVSALKDLADVLEPVKGYTREETATEPATSAKPLDRVVDAVRPESATGRQFAASVDALLAGGSRPGTEAGIRALLGRWRDNQVELQPLFEQSFLLKEVAPIAQNLSALGAAGLASLDYLDRGEHPAAAWVTQQLAVAEQAKKAQAQMLLVVVPALEKLIQASAGQAASPSPSLPAK
ncbi:MAG TPA: family 20 glycosylhydrolase [Terriglobales bacterium]|jgi:hexosaminidase|nr:family 20 glycosylhydrolase [Terriglobales bacterium]